MRIDAVRAAEGASFRCVLRRFEFSERVGTVRADTVRFEIRYVPKRYELLEAHRLA